MKAIFTLVLLLFGFTAIAQCPSTGEVYLYEQSDIDNYFANGGCTVVENLIIGSGSPNITNLNGLNGITTVTGSMFVGWLPLVDFTGLETLTSINVLNVEWCPLLKNFKGLENVTDINYLSVNQMDNLESFEGLEAAAFTNTLYIGGCAVLTTLSSLTVPEVLTDGVFIVFCPSLVDLSSLSNLQSAARITISNLDLIENFQWLNSLEEARQFSIQSCAKLTSLNGLENLSTVETLHISDNPILASIEALATISSNLTDTRIYSNSQLSNCSINAICAMLLDPSPGDTRVIQRNKGACLDRLQLELACKETMPVRLLSFEAVLEKQLVNLIWKTSEEHNSEKFEVHHSTNGKDWFIIGELKSSGIGGLGSEYHFTHQTPAQGNNYYRLKMIDFDRTHALSTISHAYFNAEAKTVYPNPTSDAIHISSLNPGQIASFELVNSKGNVVMKRESGTLYAINMDKFPAGSYTLRIFNKDSTVSNHKILVNK
ncbi:T9SS type A sorting domain-containing protein [Dyadobacter sp. CY107]|uniref:T9SS type A sorting domain-containing protein n=1 Tax=Dyadobacter fanqingshengii TaxID=2906443 RepID=UPI001F184A48|nr:T9SS type A sorting domain-containing protein [Dyadobacter fanqingshengii]MCF2506851.1 T9SS type A sorting domain-containing protein [Dyadobacter fanqingshengii]